MCTISFIPVDGGYSVFMNRDESPLRPRTLRLESGPGFAFPVDAQSGGTWIGLNRQGLALCIMNQHPSAWAPRSGLVSRGMIIPALLKSASPVEAVQELEGRDLSHFAPFKLLALGAEGAILSLAWDGNSSQWTTFPRSPLMLCSSGVRYTEVQASRAALFQRLLQSDPSQAMQARFHRSHEPQKGALSVCLHRPESVSVSLTELNFRPEGATLKFRPGPLCESGDGVMELSL